MGYSSLSEVIHEINTNYKDMLNEKTRLLGAFRDLAPDLIGECRKLSYLFDCGGTTVLLKVSAESQGQQDIAVNKIVNRLVSEYFIAEDVARDACIQFLYGINGEYHPATAIVTPPIAKRGADAVASFDISFKESMLGCRKTVSIPGQGIVTVNVPAGINNGQTITFTEMGYPGINGGVAGDLIVTVNVINLNEEDTKTPGENYRDGLKYYNEENYGKAFNSFSQAANAGNLAAIIYLGSLYEDGKGVACDYSKAMEWYKKAAASGVATAMNKIGYMYEHAVGVNCDYDKAIEWYEKAAASGYETAKHNLDNVKKKVAENEQAKLDELFVEAKKHFEKDEYGQALVLFSQAANAGNPEAMRYLGFLYEDGKGIACDYSKAMEWYKKAAASGDTGAMNNIGYMYQYGEGIDRDYLKAKEWYEKAAAAGNETAKRNLDNIKKRIAENEQAEPGELVAEGKKHFEKDEYGQALVLFSQAANAGNPEAMRYLGFLYEDGKGIACDYSKAMEWYKKAAASGEAIAMNNIGYMYQYGEGIDRDYLKAKEWYEKAAAAGIETAKRNLDNIKKRIAENEQAEPGELVAEGKKHFEKDEYGQALVLFSQAANAGNPEAMAYLGKLYEDGKGIACDYSKAMEWYKKAAASGEAIAMNNIGYMYQYGEGVNRDYYKAKEWYEKATAAGLETAKRNLDNIKKRIAENEQAEPGELVAEGKKHFEKDEYGQALVLFSQAANAGNPEAMAYLGKLYEDGKGIACDYSKAMEWYEKAASVGDTAAMSNIGYMYHYGEGVNRDYIKAKEWYEKAAAAGNASAMNIIGYMYRHGEGVNRDYFKAMVWYKKAAAAGDINAMNNIGYMYHYGEGVNRNYIKAKEWYEKAAAAGLETAKSNLDEVKKIIGKNE